jgi:uncharacterized protein
VNSCAVVAPEPPDFGSTRLARVSTRETESPQMRECGSCSLCCRLLEISAERAPEIGDKPAGMMCRHCAAPGCSIYGSRPQLCADFKCVWLSDERLGPEWYPPIAGMILSYVEDSATLFVILDPSKPNMHRRQPYALDLARMAAWGKRSPEPFAVRIADPPTQR